MRIVNCLIILLLSQVSTAQQVVRKVRYSGRGDKEIFHVLASDSSTLHGRYERIEYNSRVEGVYNNGLQDGVWTEYNLRYGKYIKVQGPYKDGFRNGLWTVYSSKKKLKSKGYYKDDQRIGFWRFFNNNGEIDSEGYFTDGQRSGKWTFYNDKGDVDQEYNYTTKKVETDVLLADLSQKQFRVIKGQDTVLSQLQRPPLYIGGKSKLFLTKIIQFPLEQDSIKVQVRFVIDKQGRINGFRVVESGGRLFDQEAIFTFRQLSYSWLPATLDGQLVEVEHSLTFLFTKTILKKQPSYFYRTYWPGVDEFPTSRQFTVQNDRPIQFISPNAVSVKACKLQVL